LGCYNLGFLYQHGQGVPQSYIKAAMLFKKACKMGSGAGCTGLGSLYKDGQGVPQSYIKAATLYEKACKMGSG
ncbi:tetratricopeptide repeat protein, partial [Hydrogenobaculum acidophilum]